VTGFDAKARPSLPFATQAVDLRLGTRDPSGLAPFQAVLSCLPYHLNNEVAKARPTSGASSTST